MITVDVPAANGRRNGRRKQKHARNVLWRPTKPSVPTFAEVPLKVTDRGATGIRLPVGLHNTIRVRRHGEAFARRENRNHGAARRRVVRRIHRTIGIERYSAVLAPPTFPRPGRRRRRRPAAAVKSVVNTPGAVGATWTVTGAAVWVPTVILTVAVVEPEIS